MKGALSWLGWWIALAALWLLLVDTSQRYELWAGAGAAALGATTAEILRRQGLLGFEFDVAWVMRWWTLPFQVILDFGVVSLALWRRLVLRRPVHGAFREVPFEAAGPGERAFETVARCVAPNTFVVDVDSHERRMLVHDLVP